MLNPKDKEIIRALAAKVAEIAALPVQAEKRDLWRKLNALQPKRPMVMIDQVCWNEMNNEGNYPSAVWGRNAGDMNNNSGECSSNGDISVSIW